MSRKNTRDFHIIKCLVCEMVCDFDCPVKLGVSAMSSRDHYQMLLGMKILKKCNLNPHNHLVCKTNTQMHRTDKY